MDVSLFYGFTLSPPSSYIKYEDDQISLDYQGLFVLRFYKVILNCVYYLLLRIVKFPLVFE